MKTDLMLPLRYLWLALSDVPGWPDAPNGIRLRRLWPLLTPLVGILLLATWLYGFRLPQTDRERASHAHLAALEQEIETLRQACSEQGAGEAAGRLEEVRRALLASPAELPELMNGVVAHARTLGWILAYQAYDVADEDGRDEAGRLFVPTRLRLESSAGAPDPFSTLLTLLDHLSRTGRRLDMTRIAVRANENGRLFAEANLRVACHPSHEKTPE